MATPKERSVFWIVSTHVLTTGFAMPAVAYVATVLILMNLPRLEPWLVMGLTFGLLTLGYVGGVFYSLNYVRKVAIIRRPLACITPSIITFTVLEAVGFGLNARAASVPLLAMLAAYYVAIGLVFAFVTRRAFRGMVEAPRGFPVQVG